MKLFAAQFKKRRTLNHRSLGSVFPRVGCGVVAPQAEAVHVQPGGHAVAVHHVGLLLIQHHLRAVRQAGRRDGDGLVAGADVGGVVVHRVRVGRQGRRQDGAAVNHLAHLAIEPHPVGVGVAHRLGLLGGLHVGVPGRAAGVALDVHHAHRLVHAVDVLGLGLKGGRHRGVHAVPGATRIPGVMPSRGYTCRTTSRPVSFPLDTSTPPTMSDAFTLLGSSWLPLTVRLVALLPPPRAGARCSASRPRSSWWCSPRPPSGRWSRPPSPPTCPAAPPPSPARLRRR